MGLKMFHFRIDQDNKNSFYIAVAATDKLEAWEIAKEEISEVERDSRMSIIEKESSIQCFEFDYNIKHAAILV